MRVGAGKHIVLRPATALAWIVLVGTLVVVIALLTARGGLTLLGRTDFSSRRRRQPVVALPSATAVATLRTVGDAIAIAIAVAQRVAIGVPIGVVIDPVVDTRTIGPAATPFTLSSPAVP